MLDHLNGLFFHITFYLIHIDLHTISELNYLIKYIIAFEFHSSMNWFRLRDQVYEITKVGATLRSSLPFLCWSGPCDLKLWEKENDRKIWGQRLGSNRRLPGLIESSKQMLRISALDRSTNRTPLDMFRIFIMIHRALLFCCWNIHWLTSIEKKMHSFQNDITLRT